MRFARRGSGVFARCFEGSSHDAFSVVRLPMKIVHAIHDFLPRHRAGSEIYALELCRALARRHDVTILCAEYDPSRKNGSTSWRTYDGLRVVEVVNNWVFASLAKTYQSRTLNRSFKRVLTAIRPDVVHIHNLLNLSMDLPAVAKALGVSCVATLHDYTLVCPSGGQRVHMAEQHVCTEIDPERCARCFPQSHFYSQMVASRIPEAARRSPTAVKLTRVVQRLAPQLFESLERRVKQLPVVTARDVIERLEKVREVFDTIDLFIAPSAALGAEYRRLGLPAAKLRVSDYGFARFDAAPRTAGGRLRIGFVGTLVWHKGPHVLLEAVQHLPADKFELKLFGDPNVFPDYVRTLRRLAHNAPVRFMGGFDQSRMPDVYAEIDVLVVPSLWPENSPLVIHEAFMAGVPVVGSRQGGIPELVTHEKNGLIYEAYSAVDLRAALERLIDQPDLLRRFGRELPAVKSIEQDAEEWEGVYDSLVGHAARAGWARR
jgi:glycosyltransferase involved in cell wall biosynthesis